MTDVVELERAGAGEKAPLRLWLRLLATANLLAGELGARLRARHGISLAQFDYLAQLHRSGEADVAMSELGRRLMVTSGNVTGLTDRLERQGWVKRERAAHDRRTQFVRLTAGGPRALRGDRRRAPPMGAGADGGPGRRRAPRAARAARPAQAVGASAREARARRAPGGAAASSATMAGTSSARQSTSAGRSRTRSRRSRSTGPSARIR